MQLTGGLGNQMFNYVGLKFLSKSNNVNFKLDGRPIYRISGRNPDIFDFKLDGEQQIKGMTSNTVHQYLDAFIWKRKWLATHSRRYQSPVLGRDQDIASVLSSRYLRSFFQSKEYADNFQSGELKTFFSLKEHSQKLSRMISSLENESTLVLHIRRGDYRNHSNDFGLLSLQYYRKAIEIALAQKIVKNIWIFSDEISATHVLAKYFTEIKFNYVSKYDFSPAETLKLMSSSKNLVIANSTFSWWAAYLSEEAEVYRPETWFRRESTWLYPDELFPHTWHPIQSEWEI